MQWRRQVIAVFIIYQLISDNGITNAATPEEEADWRATDTTGMQMCISDCIGLTNFVDGLRGPTKKCFYESSNAEVLGSPPPEVKTTVDTARSEVKTKVKATTKTPCPSFKVNPQALPSKVICWVMYSDKRTNSHPRQFIVTDISTDMCTHVVFNYYVTLDKDTFSIVVNPDLKDELRQFTSKLGVVAGVSTLVKLGGWAESAVSKVDGTSKYSRMVATKESRASFIKQALDFTRRFDLSGLVLSWVHPVCWQNNCNAGPAEDRDNYAALVQEMTTTFKAEGFMVAITVPYSSTFISKGYKLQLLAKHAEWIDVMTFDYHGPSDKKTLHSAPLADVRETMEAVRRQVDSPSKLIMALPMYARTQALTDSTNFGLNEQTSGAGIPGPYTQIKGMLAYFEACKNLKKETWNIVRSLTNESGPYASRDGQWICYDDVESIRAKVQNAQYLGLGGISLWSIDQDDFTGDCGCGASPLLRAVAEELRGFKCQLSNCT